VIESEALLVERCISGDESAMRRFVQRFEGLVFGLSLRMMRRREDAEDVVQDVFLRTFRSLNRWDSERPLAPWIIAITANRCRTALDRRSKCPSSAPVTDHIPDRVFGACELAEELQAAVRQLRPEFRNCFELFYHDELSVSEVGARLGVPQGTVKTWLYRARKELADHLERRGITPGVKP
jgi:RNA polymerase sigma-70 factor (ECF subfamily)